MRRQLLIGNGKMRVAVDDEYAIRELYCPHLGQSNYLGDRGIRFVIGVSEGDFYAINSQQWRIKSSYIKETLCSSVSLSNSRLQVLCKCNEVVDYSSNVFVRRFSIRNLSDEKRLISIYACQDFVINDQGLITHRVFDERCKLALNYSGERYLASAFLDRKANAIIGGYTSELPDELFEIFSDDDISQESGEMAYLRADIELGAFEESQLYFVIIVGNSYDDIIDKLEYLKRNELENVIKRTCAYWRFWNSGTDINFGNLPARVVDGFKRSLLTLRMYINNNGSIITEFDSSSSGQMQGVMGTFSAACVSCAFDMSGLAELSRLFYSSMFREFQKSQRVLPRYNPDYSAAEICFARDDGSDVRLADMAILLWGLWRHYFRLRDIEYICSLWPGFIKPLFENMLDLLNPPHYFPPEEIDIWNNSSGITLFTSCLVHSAIIAGENFAICFGESELSERSKIVANELKHSIERYFFSEKLGRFVSAIYPIDDKNYEYDAKLDASMLGIVKFGTFDADDERVIATMSAVSDELWVKTPVGGLTRFENDFPSDNEIGVLGNTDSGVSGWPSFVATFWLAQFLIEKADKLSELRYAVPILEWAMTNATSSGFFANKLSPYQANKAVRSECPDIFSHAEFIITIINYLEKLEKLNVCEKCGQGIYRMKKHRPMRIRVDDILTEYSDKKPNIQDSDRMIIFERDGKEVILRIDTKECIGCSVCLANCPNDIFDMLGNKPRINRNNIRNCNLCGQCQDVCPVGAIHISYQSITMTQ